MLQPFLEHIGMGNSYVNSLVAITIFYILLTFSISELVWLGFFTGMIMFYWIGFSFYYFGMPYLIPLVIIAIGLVYATMFGFFAYIANLLEAFTNTKFHIIFRAILAVYYFDIVTLFGFNWFKPELFLAETFFGISKLHLLLILLGIAGFASLQNRLRFTFVFLPILSISIQQPLETPNIKIYLANTNTKFESKYNPINISNNLDIIDSAIKNGYDLVALPETSFPFPLNRSPEITDILLEKSHHISIICGSIRVDGKSTYNSNYLFSNGHMSTFDKVIGVPFGEVNPMPKFMSDFVNRVFFDGADDFKTAEKFSDFEIKGVKFRNAICYEATKDEAYEGSPAQMIALSNNGWFVPSLEPELQKMLITFYSKKYKTVVYHAVNESPSFVVN